MPARVYLMALNASGLSGVPRYTATLARALDAVNTDFPDLELTLVTTSVGAATVAPTAMSIWKVDLFGRRTSRGPVRLLLEQALAPMARADVIHYFDVGGPFLAPRQPFVLTFHDAALRHPELCHFGPLQRSYKQMLYPWSLSRARAIIAVSEFAKQEAVRYFGVEPRTITVVHSGPGLTPLASGPTDRQTRRPYVLFVGSLTAGKNVPFLIRAFERSGVDADLVLAGRPIEAVSMIEDMVRTSSVGGSIRLVLKPSDADLDRLYARAIAVVLPSLYEGFGFTSLEAMTRGCPVLASDIPAVREVSGTGALLLPLEERAWADAIRRVVAEPELRASLIDRGRRTVERYSWERTARGVCEVLLRVAAEGSPISRH